MQNSHELRIEVDAQVRLLAKRYYLNLAWMDKMAVAYQQLGILYQTMIYFALSAGLLVSVISLNITLLLIFSLAWLWISTLKQHYQALQQRLDVMLQDLTISEQQLNQAVAENQKLKEKLEEAVIENTKVVQHLLETRQEMEQISAQAKLKDLEIEGARQQLLASSEKITALTTDLIIQKQAFSEKMAGFFLFLDQSSVMMGQGGSTTGPHAHPS